MSIYTYHIVKTSIFTAVQLRFHTKLFNQINGLVDFEIMTAMELDAPIYSLQRFYFHEVILFSL